MYYTTLFLLISVAHQGTNADTHYTPSRLLVTDPFRSSTQDDIATRWFMSVIGSLPTEEVKSLIPHIK